MKKIGIEQDWSAKSLSKLKNALDVPLNQVFSIKFVRIKVFGLNAKLEFHMFNLQPFMIRIRFQFLENNMLKTLQEEIEKFMFEGFVADFSSEICYVDTAGVKLMLEEDMIEHALILIPDSIVVRQIRDYLQNSAFE